MRVLFATAELHPVVTVGGLGHAAAGLVRELRRQGVEVDVVLPDYGGVELAGEETLELAVPAWAAPATARRGTHPAAGALTLVSTPRIARPHPYLDEHGAGWADNDARFLAFSAAVASLADETDPDVVHLNDWHTATAAAAIDERRPIVLTVHNLVYQGRTGADWLELIGPRAWAYARDGGCNPLAGCIALAGTVALVSPTYREEVLRPKAGAGLEALLRERGNGVVGILNGIDTDLWNPAADPHLPAAFEVDDLSGKQLARSALLDRVQLPDEEEPIAVAVTRLTEQKGIDLVLALVPELEPLGLRLAVLGAGDAWLADGLRSAAAERPASLAFVAGYDEQLSHLFFGGGDLLLMPSRFEPCGLAQMQAMRYGTLPVVTDVGGLHDTVVDLDDDPLHGTGWRAATADVAALWDALVRAVRDWADPELRSGAQRRAMTSDWSWSTPASQYVELYRRLTG